MQFVETEVTFFIPTISGYMVRQVPCFLTMGEIVISSALTLKHLAVVLVFGIRGTASGRTLMHCCFTRPGVPVVSVTFSPVVVIHCYVTLAGGKVIGSASGITPILHWVSATTISLIVMFSGLTNIQS
jgi:hypothetical protein